MEPLETIKLGDFRAEIVVDEDPPHPKEWDNLGHYAHWHPDYDIGGQTWNIGERQFTIDEPWFPNPDHFEAVAKKKGWVYLPIALLDHGSLHLYVGDSEHWADPGGWDSGQVGFIYATTEDLRKEYSCRRITKKVREQAIKVLEGEVQTMSEYYQNSVYGYIIYGPDGEETDSLWGIYGFEYARNEAQAALENEVERALAHV